MKNFRVGRKIPNKQNKQISKISLHCEASKRSQYKITPLSRLNGDTMVAKWQLNCVEERWISVKTQSLFSPRSGRYILVTLSRLPFLKKCGANTGPKSQKESTLTIRPGGPLIRYEIICNI